MSRATTTRGEDVLFSGPTATAAAYSDSSPSSSSLAGFLREKFNLPKELDVADRVLLRTAARVNASAFHTVDDTYTRRPPLKDKNEETRNAAATTTGDERASSSSSSSSDALISSLKRDLSQANAKSRRLSKMVDCREKEIEDLKRTAMTLNREKALLVAEDRNKAIESGMRESQVERKQIERELVIPRGLAETDADAKETWLKLLRSADACFVRFARAIRKRENEMNAKEKELSKAKECEKLCRDQLMKNEKEMMHLKIKAERLESERNQSFEASSQPLREEISALRLSEEKARTESALLKRELEEMHKKLSSAERKIADAETAASLAKAKESAKEKECSMFADLVRELSEIRHTTSGRRRAKNSNNEKDEEEEEEEEIEEDSDSRDEDEDEEFRRNDEVSNLLLKCCEPPARKT
jgi:DNA-binding protein